MIHQYKLNGYNIVLDVYSGSVHAVDELAYDAIALVDAGHPRAEAADLLAKKYADHPEVTAEVCCAVPAAVCGCAMRPPFLSKIARLCVPGCQPESPADIGWSTVLVPAD